MSDVARKAGVSTMTVSRALRDGASIANETREKIMKAVEELGYVLDQSAGSLSSKRTGCPQTGQEHNPVPQPPS